MNEKQKAGMILFHKKAEAAYLKFGETKKARKAKEMREKLEKQTE